MLLLALAAGLALGWANVFFHVPVDPRLDKLNEALPGANCGGCGFVGCSEYAAAVLEGRALVNKCTVGGVSCAKVLAKIMGVDATPSWPYRPAVHCGARLDQRLKRAPYSGEPTCAAANVISGIQGCVFGCLGLSDCERSCKFDAIAMIDGLAVVDYQKCTGCGACAKVCPRNIISMVPFKAEQMVVIACSNQDFGKEVREVCKVGCIGCRACERLSDLFKVENNLARIDYDKYDPKEMGKVNMVLEKCPMRRIIKVGSPSEKDLAKIAGQEMPSVVTPDFKTTVDKTDWHG